MGLKERARLEEMIPNVGLDVKRPSAPGDRVNYGDRPSAPEPTPYDEVWPGEENWETLWKQTGGVDVDGGMWLTPRMKRIAAETERQWNDLDENG